MSGPIQMVPESDLDAIVARADRDLQQLSQRRILITGVSGFFGKWLLSSLLHANRVLGLGLHVTGLARRATGLLSAFPGLLAERSLTLTDVDVTTFSELTGTVDDVFHLATPASAALNRDQPLEMLRIIETGTRNVLERSRDSGARRFLLASSGAVYGRLAAGSPPVSETYQGAPDPLDVGTSYHQGKRLAEHLGALIARDGSIEVKLARCFAFAGPHLPLDAHFAFGNFLRDAAQGRHIHVHGDGTAIRSYLYAADLVVWLLAILVRGAPSRPYNVGSEFAVSIEQLAGRIAAAAGSGYSVARAAGSDAPDVYVPDTTRARFELDLREWTDLDGAIARTLTFIRARDAHRCE